MHKTVATTAAGTQSPQGTPQQGTSNREGEQSACQRLLTSPFSYGDGGNTILSTDNEYLNEVYSELLDKGVCKEAEGSTGGSGPPPDALDTLDPSSRILAAYHGQLSADCVYRTHKHKPPNGFGYWQFEATTRKKYARLANIMSKREGREQVDVTRPSN
ncbi:unnamed protein product [Rhizoctonia solani]|uniref:Uncharacterized protein n=1 Tax=Rhizoctonia solani TaxID=456999 RepID=A0A8H3GT74_9AGAM|nr:unnamed protein product [Rhizoctonia solani]